MENNESPQTEIMLGILNILTTVDGNTVTIVDNLQIRTAQLSPAKALTIHVMFIIVNHNML